MKLLPPSLRPWEPRSAPADRIAVLMSGGVDSSVTAHLLKSQGWDVVGITMQIPLSCNPSARSCCGADAAFVCKDLDIPHYFIDVRAEFEQHIIERFRSEYERGRTPNPCADCNTILKYSLVLDFVKARFDLHKIASGHYARIAWCGDVPVLKRAVDQDKDQSYFLYGIDPARLKDIVFPLGELRKEEVRRLAQECDLPVWDKQESMELCFCGDDYREGLSAGQTPGPIKDLTGAVLGQHEGIENYTIGQRKGLGIATGEPCYVVAIDTDENTVHVGSREAAMIKTVAARLETVFLPDSLRPGGDLNAKIRSYGTPSACVLKTVDGDCVTVEFAEPLLAPSAGQKLVLYTDEGLVVAGGTVSPVSLKASNSRL